MKLENIIKKFSEGKAISKDELDYIAYFNLRELSDEESDIVENAFFNIMHTYGEPWSDYDENFPDNPFHERYLVDGKVYITSYSGVAGEYWHTSDEWPICKWQKRKD